MRKLIACCLALSLPLAARANGYDVPNVSPRDLGMASAAVAAQVDAGAAYVLPAALARLDGLSLSIGGSLLDLRTTWNATTPELQGRSPADLKTHLAPPFSAFASYSGRFADRGFGVGVGANIPAGGNVFWPDDWAGRSRIITVDRKVYAFYGSFGVEVLKQLRLGGGLVYYRTTEFLTQGVEPTTGQAQLSTAGGKLSYDVSAEITPVEGLPLSFAIDYKHQAIQNLTGTAHFDVPPTLQPLLQDQNVTHVLPYPSVLNVGVAYQAIPPLTLGFVYTFNHYSVYSEDAFIGDKPLPGPIVVPRDYGNGYTLRLGAEYLVTPRLAVRAGILRDISGMPKQDVNGSLTSPTYSPTLPDSNSWAGSIGAGWSFAKNFTVSGTIFYAKMDEVSATPGTTAFQGRYDTDVFIYSLGLTYNWMPGEGIGAMRSFQ
jgi:long-chain fatty acid transport protein